MLQANELRIGNYVNVPYREEPQKWTVLDFWQNVKSEPIPLTEEWLLKFGFEYDHFLESDEFKCWNFKKNNVSLETDIEYSYFVLDGWNGLIPHIKHVHQLQNLYFALTGEELTIKK